MNANEEALRRLTKWNRFWCAIFVIALLVWNGNKAFQHYVQNVRHNACDLKVIRTEDEGLAFVANCDGPFIITHIIKTNADEGDKAVALLTRPIAIIDSDGAKLDKSELDKLTWISVRGQKMPAPSKSDRIGVLFYEPHRKFQESPKQSTAE